MSKGPLDVTDRRRAGAGDNSVIVVHDTNGAGPDLSDLFRDRRKSKDVVSYTGNGKGAMAAFNGKGKKAA